MGGRNFKRVFNWISELCPALMAIEHWRFFSVPHLLWHRASFYNGHLQWPVTLTPNAERLAVEKSLPVLTTYICRGWGSNIQPSACGANAQTHCATAAAVTYLIAFGKYAFLPSILCHILWRVPILKRVIVQMICLESNSCKSFTSWSILNSRMLKKWSESNGVITNAQFGNVITNAQFGYILNWVKSQWLIRDNIHW